MNIFKAEIEAENLQNDLKNQLIDITNDSKKLSEFKSILVKFKQKHNFKACGRFTKIYWTQRGWSNDEAIIKKAKYKRKLKPGPMEISFWLEKINPLTNLVYTKVEAKHKIKTQRPINIEYWINKGLSKDEAIIKVKEIQTKNGDAWVKKNKKHKQKDRTRTQILYWQTKHNMSLIEARAKVKEVQNNISLDVLMKKYGDIEGKIRYDKICDKISFAGTVTGYISRYGPKLGPKLHKEKTIKSCTNNRVSKESIVFFKKIYKFFRQNGIKSNEIYWGITGSQEYFLHENNNNKIFWYDFTIPHLKMIIEFHGTRFHPNPKWDKKRWGQWDLFGMKAKEKYEFDTFKKNLANKHGYTVLEIWSDEKHQFDMSILSQFIT